MSDFFLAREAEFHPDRTHRFLLTRHWDKAEGEKKKTLVMFMLNPSIADEKRDDPTTKFCMKMARREGFNWYHAINLFPVVGTDPDCLLEDEVELFSDKSLCDQIIRNMITDQADMIVLAWGKVNPKLQWRVDEVMEMLTQSPKVKAKLFCLGINKDGSPRFPRALKLDVNPQRYDLQGA